jgi:hypothetical protein
MARADYRFRPRAAPLARALAPLALVLAASGAAAAQDFVLGFEGPAAIFGAPGERVREVFTCTLTQRGGEPGGQGWAIGVAAESAGDAVDIVHATREGSDIDGRQLFFEITRLTAGEGNEGAISVAVLLHPELLPVGDAMRIALLVVDAVMPAAEAAFTLRYVDGLRGEGLPVENSVTYDGGQRTPELGALTVRLVPGRDCCGAPVNAGFSIERLSSPEPFAGLDGIGSTCVAAGERELRFPSGAPPRLGVHASLVSQLEGEGVQGWSLAVAVSGDARVAAARPLVEAAIDGPPAYERTRISGAPGAGAQQVVLSAVVLSFESLATLPARGTESVLVIDVEALPSEAGGPGEALFVFDVAAGGTAAPGEPPLPSVAVINGESIEPCNAAGASLCLRFVPEGGRFRRGEANGDASTDIADALFTLGALFLGGPPPACADAADVNDDSSLDIADAVFLLRFLFLGGPPPPAPGGDCGEDPTADGLVCFDGGECGGG